MKVLRDRIMQDGRCLEGGILKVDRFINHQMDPYLMKQIAIEFIRRFADEDVTKIITVEASGIAPAIMLGYLMELPVVFAKKKKPSYLTSEDNVLFIDDFLAYGNAGLGIIDLCQQAGATIVGMGFIIEKAFQHGRKVLQDHGIHRIESLAIIESLENNEIKLK